MASSSSSSSSSFMSCVGAVARAVSASNSLPSMEKADYDFYSTFESFRDVVDTEKCSVMAVLNKLLQQSNVKKQFNMESSNGDSSVSVDSLSEFLADVNDLMLERINTNLDVYEGLKKTQKEEAVLVEVTSDAAFSLMAAKNVLRPQMNFSKLIDTSNKPFVHRLTDKPHCVQSLEDSPNPSHPYIYELDHFEPDDSNHVHLKPEDTDILSKEANFEFVDNETRLEAMIELLEKEKIIGVDVEAHWYRSFMGLSCLIQISTTDTDYVVDPFPLWPNLTALNRVLANPNIVKVMHGADGDVVWLQRDFSLYIVNLFDTHQAAIVLEQPAGQRSLAALIQQNFGVKLDKRFQLADWRLRPLPKEMLDYARADVRLLIPLFVKLRDQLLLKANEELNLIRSVWNRSTVICRQVFLKPELKGDSHLQLLKRSKLAFDTRQTFALKKLFGWRFETARTEDESFEYVLPNHMLIKICQELPRELQGLVACCKPMPPLVKQFLLDLHKIVITAREVSQEQLIKSDVKEQSELAEVNGKDGKESQLAFNLGSVLDLSCPIQQSEPPSVQVKLKKNAFLSNVVRSDVKRSEKPLVNSTFHSPYERFCMLEPYLKYVRECSDKVTDDDVRTQSIKDHFDALTASTPKENKEEEDDSDDKEEGDNSGEEEDDDDDQSLMTGNATESNTTLVKNKNRKRKWKSSKNTFIPKKAKLIDRDEEEQKELEEEQKKQETKKESRMDKLLQSWFDNKQKQKENKKGSRQFNAWQQQNSKGKKGKGVGGSAGAKRKAKNMNKSVSYKKK